MTSPPTILELKNVQKKYYHVVESHYFDDDFDYFDDDFDDYDDDCDDDYDDDKHANLDRSSSPERPKAMYWPSFSRATNYHFSQLLSSGL